MADTEDTCKILVFFVNGKKIQDPDIDPEITLLYYLRNKLKLCGTKLGCGEGGCGACTVMISKYHPQEENIRHYSVNSCLTPVASVHGLAVTTVEGIRSTRNKLHVVQERIAKAHGSQCGFCTPGMVMSMYTLLRNNPIPSMAQLEEYLTGNLCRCTGYRPILDGFRGLTSDGMVIEGCGRADCCKFLRDKPGVINVPNCPVNGINEDNNVLEENDISHILYENDFKPYDPSQEVIFPPELKVHPELQTQNLEYRGPRLIFYRPSTLQQLLKLKAQHPEARLIVGNTEVGVEVKYKNKLYPVLINPSNIHDLTAVKRLDSGLQIGASVTLSKIGQILREEIKERKEHQTRIFTAILEMLKWFAGKQIRNVAAIGGNIMTGSPISDLNPLLMAARATLTFCSKERGERKLLMDENFFTGYRKTIALNDEILLYVHIPYTSMDEYMYSYKQSRRRGDDVAIVNAGMKVIFRKENDAVQDIVLAFGGMGPTIVMATNTMKELTGMSWNSSLLERGLSLLLEDLPLSPSAPGGMTEYRRALALSFFFKYYLNVLRQLSLRMPDKVSPLAEEELRAIEEPEHMLPRSTQLFQKVPPSQSTVDPIGRPMIHTSALKQATGEAVYIDDMPHYENELYASFVYSSHAHAKIISIDESEALNVDGVVRFFCARDLAREKNRVSKDNVVFVQDVVTCVGQIIGMIVAKNQPTAQRAAKLVKIQYEDIKPLIITIQDAIREKSYFNKWTLYKGNTESALNTSAHVLEGEMHVGGQEHFYLETQAQLVVPSCEDGTMEIFSSTQNPTDMQEKVAHVLGVLKNRVICRVKRLGGGFGGKETKPPFVAMPLCIAAAELNCPVRIMLDRHEDMVLTGGRHPFLCKWKVGFSDQGILLAIDADLYANAGYSLDISHAVVQNAMFAMDNAYKCDNVKIIGYVCKTNLPSNTAFRGFGTPQSTIFAEDIISRIAAFLNANANVIRERNMYRTGDTTHSKEILERCTVRRCWDEVLDQASFHIRKTRVDTFNKENKYRKRGLVALPIKMSLGFLVPCHYQAAALVLVYTDGSVLISHGGAEMGQGLHTKMIQVAARVLKIPADKILIAETSTDKVPNTTSTAASVSSDLYGMAVLNACTTIQQRLEPVITKNPKGSWEDWVKEAYLSRISLSATGFDKSIDITGYDFDKQEGSTYPYNSYGAAVTEVEIDCLTGNHSVLKTDIVMDVGESLNPAIDIGQIEGAFVQGMGLFTLEELRYSPEGVLLTQGPGAYKIPGFDDIPREFNVSLLRGAPNPRAVFSSKGVGEPPLLLATSVFYAIKDAIAAVRGDAGLSQVFRFDSPATVERIRMACQDFVTKEIQVVEPGSYKPWSVTV